MNIVGFIQTAIFAWWLVAASIGWSLINSALQYRRAKEKEQEAEEQRLESYSDPSLPHVSEGDPIPVVFGTVRLTGPNVVMVTEDGGGMARPNSRDFIPETGDQRLRLHLVFCQGPIDEVVEFQSGSRRLAEGQNTSPPSSAKYRTSDEQDIVRSWQLSDHYDLTGESIYEVDPDEDEFGPAPLTDGGDYWELDRESAASWHDFAWMNGYPDQAVDETLRRWSIPGDPSPGYAFPAYRGLFGCRGRIVWEFATNLDHPSVVVRRNTVGSFGQELSQELWATPTDLPNGQMNGVAIIEEAITDKQWGVGTPRKYISDGHFAYAANPPDISPSDELGLSAVWSDRQPFGDFIGEVLRHIDGALYIEPTTAEYVIRLIRDDYDLATMTQSDGTFGEKEIITILPEHVIDIKESRPTTKELVNEVTVNYTTLNRPVAGGVSAQRERQRSITEHDTAAQRFREPITRDIEFPFVTDHGLAARLAARELTELGHPLRSFEIEVPEDIGKDLRPADITMLVYPDYGIEQMAIRITGMTGVGDEKRTITIEAKQDIFAAKSAITATPAEIDTPQLTPPPEPASATYASEAPFWWVYEMYRQESPGLSPDDNFADDMRGHGMMAATTDQAAAINWDLDVVTGSNDTAVAFSPVSFVDFSIPENGTSAAGVFETPDDFDPLPDEEIAFFEIDGRIVAAVDWDLDAATATFRVGVHDTTPETWANGWSVSGEFMVLAYGYYQEERLLVRRIAGIEQGIGTPQGYTHELRSLPRTLRNRLSAASADPSLLDIDIRRPRPYPPGFLDYDDSEDSGEGGQIIFTWSHRDRSGHQVYQSDPDDIAPPSHVRWVVNIWSLDSAMEKEHHLVVDDDFQSTESSYIYPNDDELDDMDNAGAGRQLADRLLFEIDAIDGQLNIRSWMRNRISYRRNA